MRDTVYTFASSRYINWSKLLIQGVFPVMLLTYFNKKIYTDVKERQERLRRPSGALIPSAAAKVMKTVVVGAEAGNNNADANGGGGMMMKRSR